MPLILDASKDVAGVVRAESWFGATPPGVGQVIADVSLSGINSANQFVALGATTVEVLNTGAEGVELAFSFDLPDLVEGMQLKGLTFDVEIHGVNWNSGNLGLEGDSRFTLPILVPAPPA